MHSPLIGQPQRLEPFKSFLSVIAKTQDPILISGPTGSGKKRIIQFLVQNGSFNQEPIFFINTLQFSEALWVQAQGVLKARGTLVIEGIEHLPLILQSKLKNWLAGQGPLLSEKDVIPTDWRIISTCLSPEEVWEDLVYDFPYHIQLPSLNEVVEDIPYHIKYFLRDKSIRYVRYFFLLKTFFHKWQGNLRELEHYLIQAMSYYCSLGPSSGLNGGEEVFGEKKMRYYQDILKGEWWYYPYRFPPDFTRYLATILNKTDFRKKIIEENQVIPLLDNEPGFLVFDMTDPDFEKKAIQVYYTFSDYLNQQSK
ncbi:MAG: sigma 54-interacting transcriptional regulator [Deltaproteobacteria bacterium]|nr:sigma 54-interacting transcriptional regulator [Deltaproteobacteria bacterium]